MSKSFKDELDIISVTLQYFLDIWIETERNAFETSTW